MPTPPASAERRAVARAWAFGALIGCMAVALRAIAQPLIGDHLPFVIAFPATVVAALFCGTGPGLLAAAICAFAASSPLIPPDMALPDQPVQIGGFVVTSIVISLLCGHFRSHAAPSAGPTVDTAAAETPLTSWLRAALWGALLIPTTLFVVASWWGYQQAERDALATAARASDLAYRQAQRALETASDIARRAEAATAAADDEVRAREAGLHQRLEDLTAGLPWVVNMNVWDADGHPLVGSERFPVNRSASVADRAYFVAQREVSGAIGISEVVTGRQSGRELVNVVWRRSGAAGDFRGVVTVSVAPTLFSDYYRALAGESPGLAMFELKRTDGTLIARWASADADDATILGTRRSEAYPVEVTAAFSRTQMRTAWLRFVGLLAAVLVPTMTGLVYVTWVALRRTRREQAIAVELQEETRRRAAVERTMMESQKFETLALLTGGVAHDFNNLLAVVNTSLHVLNRLHPAVGDTKQMQAIGRAVQSGVRLTRQLLSFSRKQALRPEVIDLRTWLPSTEALAQSTLRSGVSWVLEIDPHPLPVEVDVGELELALINLVVNANLAMPDGGMVTVSAHPTPARADDGGAPFVTLAVRDTGVGIAADVLPKVCEPFFTTRARGAGSGLGLSQVQGLCTRSGGRLRIDSTVGVGTTVQMELLRAQAAAPSHDAAATTGGASAGRVLLVEDNAEVAQTMEAMLRAAGIDVVCAANAAAALALLDEPGAAAPDAVLSDIEMPGRVNGITLAFSLRSHRPGLPVILMTGYADQIDEATAGGLRVLAKPVEPERLLAELRAAMRRAPRPTPPHEETR